MQGSGGQEGMTALVLHVVDDLRQVAELFQRRWLAVQPDLVAHTAWTRGRVAVGHVGMRLPCRAGQLLRQRVKHWLLLVQWLLRTHAGDAACIRACSCTACAGAQHAALLARPPARHRRRATG